MRNEELTPSHYAAQSRSRGTMRQDELGGPMHRVATDLTVAFERDQPGTKQQRRENGGNPRHAIAPGPSQRFGLSTAARPRAAHSRNPGL